MPFGGVRRQFVGDVQAPGFRLLGALLLLALLVEAADPGALGARSSLLGWASPLLLGGWMSLGRERRGHRRGLIPALFVLALVGEAALANVGTMTPTPSVAAAAAGLAIALGNPRQGLAQSLQRVAGAAQLALATFSFALLANSAEAPLSVVAATAHLLLGGFWWLRPGADVSEQRIARRCAALMIGISGVVMIGWCVDDAVLVRAGGHAVPMQFITALAMGLSGTALLLLSAGRRQVALALQLPIIAIAALTLLEEYAGFDAGLARAVLDLGMSADAPARMAPNTAAALLLGALGIVLSPQRRASTPGRWAGTWASGFIVTAIGGIVLVGYLIGAPALRAFGLQTPMAVWTGLATAAFGLGLGFVGSRPQQARWLTGWAPLLVALGTVVAALLAWQALSVERTRAADALLAEQAAKVRLTIESGFALRLGAVQRMADRLTEAAHMDALAQQFALDSRAYLRDVPQLVSFSRADPQRVTRQVASDELDLRASIGRDAASDAVRARLFDEARRTRLPMLSDELYLDTGRRGQLIVVPLFGRDHLLGYLVVGLDHRRLFEALLVDALPPAPLRLSHDGRSLVEWQQIDGEPAHREHFIAGGLTVTLELGTPAGSRDSARLATALLMAGLLTAGLLALALRMTGLARIRARLAEHASQALQLQIAERERAEAALTASQRDIVEVLESISDAVLMIDREWRFVYVNPHAESVLRQPRGELLGRTFWDALPESAATFRPAFERALREQKALSMQEYYPPLQSWLEVRVNPHANGLVIYFRDNTVQRQQQLRLERSETLLKIAGSSARIGGWAIDLASDRMQWSDEICAIHQLPIGSTPTLSEALDHFVPEHRDRIRTAFSNCCVDGQPWDDEFELLAASGRRVWVRSIGLARRDDADRIVGAHGALQDISERKRQELQLRQLVEEKGAALESLRQVMNSAVNVIAVLDADARFVLVNAAAEAVWGYRPDELIGRTIEPLVHPDDLDATRAALAGVASGQPVLDFRNRNLTRDGRTIWMQWSARWSPQDRRAYCVGRDCSAEHRVARLEAGQRDILARIAGGEPLRDSLEALARLYEAQYPGAWCSVMLVDADRRHLRLSAAPSFPPALAQVLDRIVIGEACGACGTSAFRGERVVIADVAADPLCAGLHDVAEQHRVRACWASPVHSASGQVLATFVVYYAQVAEPSAAELHAMDGIAAVTAIAIEHAASIARVTANSARLQRLAAAGVALNRAIGQPSLYQQLVDHLRELVGAHMAVLSLTDGEHWAQSMVTVSLSERHAGWRGFDVEPTGAGIYREVIRAQASLRLSQAELEQHPAFQHFSGMQHPPLRGLLAVPLPGSDGRSLGLLQLSDKDSGDFDDDDQAIAQQFAQLAATALERSRLIERLRERDRFFDMSLELFGLFDPEQQRFLQVNPAFTQLLGRSMAELTERPFLDFVHPDDRDAAARATERMRLDHDELVGFTTRCVAADGSHSWLEWAGSSDHGGLYCMVARNITERRRIELERDHAESHDPQTGLPRYAWLEVTLADMLDRGLNPAVFYIDIDRLHGVNESMGHAVGDEALLQAAERLRAAVGDPDRLARFAGDEFVAVQPGLDREEAIAFAETLRHAVAEPVEGGSYRVYLTASIGVARAPQHGDSARELLRRAEAAMTQAKQQGRDNVCEFSAERMQLIEDRRLLGSRLRDAISAGELSLFYQPRVRATDRRVIGFEALARWDSAELGPIPPDRFVPTAEALGLMPELGHWVLQQACRQIRAWLERGHRDFSVAVNVSAHQLQRPDLVEQVRDALAAERIPPHMLDLELTESSLMENVERVQHRLAELKQLGVSLSLDDFGTGYSSLAYLKQFSLDKLKIDRRFVRDLPHGAHDVAIARTIVAMAHQLKMEVSAEGVEEEAQASFLRDIGCDELQGYWFGRPLPADQAGELFAY